MPDLYKYNGTIIAKNGLLARAQTCCCGEEGCCENLTIVYDWSGTNQYDLDTKTTFNGVSVGWNCGPYNTTYISLTSADDTNQNGSETVTVNLGQAFRDGVFNNQATITLHANWFPYNTSGPARVYLYCGSTLVKCVTISPGATVRSCASTQVGTVTVTTNPCNVTISPDAPCADSWSCSPSGCTEVNAGYGEFESQSACEAACFQGYTCAYNSGCTSIGYTTDAQTYMTASQCAAACYETYTCDTTQGCVWQGYALSGQTLQQCQSICTIQGYNCENANACVALYNVNGEFSTLGACNAVCLERATCDTGNGCQYVGYGTTGNLYSNCAQDCQILSYACSFSAACIPLYNSTAGQYTDAASCAAGCQADYQCYPDYCYVNGYSTNAQSYEACAANCPQQQMQMPEWVDISEPTPENYEVRQYLTTQSVVSSRPAPPKTLEGQDPTGPGTFLSKTLEKIGIKSSPTCSCKARALRMNEMGNDWCDENIETIVGWLREEAEKRKLPFIDMAGTLLVKRAISLSRTAKKKQAKNESTATDRTDS